MARAEPVPLNILPGVVKAESKQAAVGRYTDMDKLRFVNGRPEKVGGCERLNTETPFAGTARGILGWLSLRGQPYYAVGTNIHLYVAPTGTDLEVITPQRFANTPLNNAMSTAVGDTTVTITHVAHGRSSGDLVYLAGAQHTGGGILGGVTLDGLYTITVLDVDTYTIEAATPATSNETDGGGDLFYAYDIGTDPLARLSGSAVVTVTHAAHGAVTGDFVTIYGATAEGGIDPNGMWEVTVIDANSYTIDTGQTAASDDAAWGGKLVAIFNLRSEGASEVYRFGYGEGPYGVGYYGIPYEDTSPTYLDPRNWSLSQNGEDLIAGLMGGSVYYRDMSRGGRATRILEAPDRIRYAFMTEERCLHLLGVEGEAMRMRWSSQGTLNDFSPSDLDSAGDRRIQVGSMLVAGAPLNRGVNLIWTDQACYQHQFTGSKFIYDTSIAGRNCGLVGPNAFVVVNGAAYWISQAGFKMFSGYVQDIPNQHEIQPWLYKRMRSSSMVRAVAAYNPLFNEVWFFVNTVDGDSEPNEYAICKLDGFVWSVGTWERTGAALLNRGRSRPIWAALDGYVYQHEIGLDENEAELPWRLSTGPFAIAVGGMKQTVRGLDFDVERAEGDITLTARAWDRNPNEIIDTDVRAVDTGGMTDMKINGRWIELELAGSGLGCDFRMGAPSFELQGAGKRRKA